MRRLIAHIWNMGFDAVRWLWRYFLLGAVIVVPIWFLVRLAKAPHWHAERRNATPALKRQTPVLRLRRLLISEARLLAAPRYWSALIVDRARP